MKTFYTATVTVLKQSAEDGILLEQSTRVISGQLMTADENSYLDEKVERGLSELADIKRAIDSGGAQKRADDIRKARERYMGVRS